MGGDVTRLVLDLLPRLSAGVVVHLPDIFPAVERPAAARGAERYDRSEPYLLQAFLAATSATSAAGELLARVEPQRLQRTIASAVRRGCYRHRSGFGRAVPPLTAGRLRRYVRPPGSREAAL